MTKRYLLLVTTLLLSGISQAQTDDGSGSLSANIVLDRSKTSCTVTQNDNLAFGIVELPSVGTESITYNESTGMRSGVGIGGNIGAFTVNGVNTQTVTVTTTDLDRIRDGGNGVLNYERTWSQDGDGQGNYTTIMGDSYDVLVGGIANATHHFRLGGTININDRDPPGTYLGFVTVSVTCSDL